MPISEGWSGRDEAFRGVRNGRFYEYVDAVLHGRRDIDLVPLFLLDELGGFGEPLRVVGDEERPGLIVSSDTSL